MSDHPLIAVPEDLHAARLKRREAMTELAYSHVEDAKAHILLAFNNRIDLMTGAVHEDLIIDRVDNEAEWERIEAIADETERGKELRRLKRAISRGERRRKAVTVHTKTAIACADAASRQLREADMIEPPTLTPEAAIHDTVAPEDPKAVRRRQLEKTWKGKDRERARVGRELGEVAEAIEGL